MLEQSSITHHIQKHILSVLMYQQTARFRDLRPLRTDTNLFSYHLTALIKTDFVKKTEEGYSLSQNGLTYIDRVSTEKMSVRTQPKIITMLLVQNSDGDILLQRRNKQPYINVWTLPYGKLHISDLSIEAAAKREALEKLSIDTITPRHVGDAYIRVESGDILLSTTLAHIFRANDDTVLENETNIWVSPYALTDYALAPAVEAIVGRCFFGDDHFFEEYNEIWT
jgi:ADP-ribose pyrophosphatase YjhB (NUDIX family)